jgi:uncharacterized protein (DUF1800 family)
MRYAIAIVAFAALMAPTSQAQTDRSGTPSYREQTADQQVLQALNRLGFGPRPGDVQTVRAMGVDKWIDQQLRPDRINDSAVDQLLQRYAMLQQSQNDLAHEYTEFVRARAVRKLARKDTTNDVTTADTMAFKALAKTRVQLVAQLESSRITRAVASDRQLQEVMTDFWENHFNIYVRKGAVEPYYLVEYDKMIREHALGKFRDLLDVVAHSPAMLFYLDNAESRANPGQPTLQSDRFTRRGFFQRRVQVAQNAKNKRVNGLNENYGRELLELHTLGVDGGYTQQDVINVARALTGWTIRPPAQGGGFIFRPEWHDAAEKVVLGHKLRANRGEDDGNDVLDIVARHPSTAHFIALKLARRFVSDTPPTALVDRAAATFRKTDGDIREVVRTIVTSPEFFSRAAYRSKVKSPFEVVVSAARALGGRPDTTAISAFAVGYLGAPLFGHQAPNGYPETGDSWMNTGAILNRINFGMAVAANRLPGATLAGIPGIDSLRRASREQQVDAVIQTLLGGAVSPDTRKILISGEHPLAVSAAQAASAPSPSMNADDVSRDSDMTMTPQRSVIKVPRKPNAKNAMGRNGFGPPPQLNGFAQVVGLAIGSPEFQRK